MLVDGAPGRSGLSPALRAMSIRLRGVVSGTTADNMISPAAESAATSADSLAQTIEEDGLQGIGEGPSTS